MSYHKMGSRQKRKVDESVLKDVSRNKKSKIVETAVVNEILSHEGSPAYPLHGFKNLSKATRAGHLCKAVPGKEKTLTNDVKHTLKGLPKKHHSKPLNTINSGKNLKRNPQFNVCHEKKTFVPPDYKKGYSRVTLDSKVKQTVNSAEVVQKSSSKEHSKLKSRGHVTKTAGVAGEESSTPTVKPENFSSNWKMLQQVLQKDKRKPRVRRVSQKQNIESYKKKPDVKETEDNKRKSESKIWFDDVDDILIESLKKKEDYKQNISQKANSDGKSEDKLVKSGSFQGLTKIIAVDCEMVGVGEGGKDSVLARVSIVNHFGQCLYDKFVKPREVVTDYRTHVSGIRPENLKNGEEFNVVQEDVSRMFKGRVLVGHAIENDLKVLFLSHPRKMIRDTSTYKPFRKVFNGRKPALRKLAEKLLLVKVQEGEHSSVQDAQAAMRLYTMYRQDWEKEIKIRRKPKQKPQKKKVTKEKTFK